MRQRTRAFTLLELVIAVTLLAAFILPMLHLIADARVRTIRYTIERQVRELAQEKLHDRIHYYEVEDAGTFEEQGRPSWRWEIDPPIPRTEEEPVILIYTIRVTIPQKLEGAGEAGGAVGGAGGAADPTERWHGIAGEGSTYEYSVWTFADERWYEEQQYLHERGYYSPLYDGPVPGGMEGYFGR